MLRCYRCRGHATAGLAHFHGLSIPLCLHCTKVEMEHQRREFLLKSFERELTHITTDLIVEEKSKRRQRKRAA